MLGAEIRCISGVQESLFATKVRVRQREGTNVGPPDPEEVPSPLDEGGTHFCSFVNWTHLPSLGLYTTFSKIFGKINITDNLRTTFFLPLVFT